MTDDLAALTARVAEASECFIRGDMRRYFTLIEHTGDYTLMAPYGGETRHGHPDTSDAALEPMASWFTGGEANFEVIQAYSSGDLAVLVGVERQHGTIGGLPDQDWSLRVTQVFRRDGSGWKMMHRHADALTHPISHEVLGALARGDDLGVSGS
jgi:ketosteroid isomerase-like protein